MNEVKIRRVPWNKKRTNHNIIHNGILANGEENNESKSNNNKYKIRINYIDRSVLQVFLSSIEFYRYSDFAKKNLSLYVLVENDNGKAIRLVGIE